MARVVVFAPSRALDDEAWSALEDLDCEVIRCRDRRALLEVVVGRPAAVVVYGLHVDPAADLPVLRVVRRAAPEAALILCAAEASLETRRQVQGLAPIYYAVAPVDHWELREAVAAAIERSRADARGRSPWSGTGRLT